MKGTVRRWIRRTVALVVLVGLVVGAAFLWVNRVEVQTRIDAMSYDSTPALDGLERNLDLTPTGKYLFRASHPTLDGSSNFSQRCSDVHHADEGHLIGCFTSSKNIHLFEVKDDRLQGIVEVTAAHELMHAAWSRFSSAEREEVGKQLQRFYDKRIQKDAEFKERMDVYRSLPRGSFVNELHSVVASEVEDLPASLEKHYSRWFDDRHKITDYFNKYHDVFASLQKQADTLQDEMRDLRSKVESGSEEYEAMVEDFNRDVHAFNKKNDNYEYSEDPEEFDRISKSLQSRREDLKQRHQKLTSEADRYENMRQQLKDLSDLSVELDSKLDSELAPVIPDPED
jgi:uncharacterized protein YukE